MIVAERRRRGKMDAVKPHPWLTPPVADSCNSPDRDPSQSTAYNSPRFHCLPSVIPRHANRGRSPSSNKHRTRHGGGEMYFNSPGLCAVASGLDVTEPCGIPAAPAERSVFSYRVADRGLIGECGELQG